jgi:PPOX class probable F420-dependent enzyme
MAALSDTARTIVDDKSFATIATLEPDGTSQLSIVWVTREGDDVLVSTLEGRRKHTNLTRDPRATLLITPPGNPYAYVEIRGRATMTRQGGKELIDTLSVKYTGQPYSADKEGDVRVVVRISADHVVERG